MTMKQSLIKSATLTLVLLLFAGAANAAEAVSPLEGTFFQSAKFYVVIAVMVIILLGIFIYLFRLDRKISSLERQSKDS